MDILYLGKLKSADPLYEILLSQVCPHIQDPVFHVNRMSSLGVYKYTEEKTRLAAIGKFFKLNDSRQERVLRIKGEYDNLRKIRAYGFDTSPHYVVRPIGKEERIGLALLEEFIKGKDLDYYLKRAIYEGKGAPLKEKLSKLASFLFLLHQKTDRGETVDLDSVEAYFQKVLDKLSRQEIVSGSDRKPYLRLKDQWLKKTLVQKGKEVTVHGDATPTNFIFAERQQVVAIDLERMRNADAAFDVSMIGGEIKHAFLWRKGDPYAAEPFLKHFFESYASHFQDRRKAFKEITMRNPFYMAMTELRIARNDYLDLTYRKRLAHEALKCLEWGLRLE